MADEQQLAILKQGVKAWNEWRSRNPDTVPDLHRADLVRAKLGGAKLGGAKLRGAHLGGAYLHGAHLGGAHLDGADLGDADLGDADLSGAHLGDAHLGDANLFCANLFGANLFGANLGGAKLSGAIFIKANFTGANLRDADMTGAVVGWTSFSAIDLSTTNGLDAVRHHGPSTIGIDTLYKSHGKIPEVFLRGAGVPENLVAYIGSLVGRAIEFYSCFISYSSKNQKFAERLHADLQAKGVRCWFAPEDLKTGDRFQERIEESIRLFDKVMIVLSEESVRGRWVEREVNAAREREDHENRTVLFPIRIDDAVMDAPQPWAADVRRSRHIGDFTRWKDHDAYTTRSTGCCAT